MDSKSTPSPALSQGGRSSKRRHLLYALLVWGLGEVLVIAVTRDPLLNLLVSPIGFLLVYLMIRWGVKTAEILAFSQPSQHVAIQSPSPDLYETVRRIDHQEQVPSASLVAEAMHRRRVIFTWGALSQFVMLITVWVLRGQVTWMVRVGMPTVVVLTGLTIANTIWTTRFFSLRRVLRHAHRGSSLLDVGNGIPQTVALLAALAVANISLPTLIGSVLFVLGNKALVLIPFVLVGLVSGILYWLQLGTVARTTGEASKTRLALDG
jgi:hypothetical protein